MRPVAWPFHRARLSSGAQRVATRYFRTNAGWRACASSHPVSPQHRLRARLARGCEARPFDVSSQIARNGQAVAPLVEERADLVRRLSSRAVQLCDQLHVVGLVALADEAVEALADERPHHAIGSG